MNILTSTCSWDVLHFSHFQLHCRENKQNEANIIGQKTSLCVQMTKRELAIKEDIGCFKIDLVGEFTGLF